MPELPDVTVYVETIAKRVLDQRLEQLRLVSPFILRTVSPKPADLIGKRVRGVERLAKRIVFVLEDDLFMVVHLMVSGRFRWSDDKGAKVPGRLGLMAFDFESGTLI